MKSEISDYRHLLAWAGIESKRYFNSVKKALHINLCSIISDTYSIFRFEKNP